MKQTHILTMTFLIVIALGLLVVVLLKPIRARAALFMMLPTAAHTDHTVIHAPVATTTQTVVRKTK